MRRLFLFILCLCSYAIHTFAAPALRDSILVMQPDGSSLYIYLHGDEFGHIRTTTDGYALKSDANGFLRYATQDADGVLSINNAPIAHNINQRSTGDVNFLKTAPKAKIKEYFKTKSNPSRAAAGINTRSSDIKIGNFPTVGKVKGLIILAEFADNSFKLNHDFHQRLMNEEGFSDNGTTGSARDYFVTQSMGVFDPTFDVYGPVKLSKNLAQYGTNVGPYDQDADAEGMVIEACRLAKSQFGCNFADYDNDGDGEVEMVYVIYAGYGEHAGGSVNTIWPHKYALSATGRSISLDNKRIDTYACSSELLGGSGSVSSSIGTFCHEFSHVLGLADHYNTVNQGVNVLGEFDLMESGSYNNNSKTPAAYNAFERYTVGWLELEEINTKQDAMQLEHIVESNKAYKLTTSNPNEYYILENRQKTGWDAYLPASGLMITHVDYNKYAWTSNSVNDNASHPRFRLIAADNNNSAYSMSKDLYPIAGNNSFTDESKPASITWRGEQLNKWITNITNRDGIVTFDFMENKLASPQNPMIREVTPNGFKATWEYPSAADGFLVTLNKLVLREGEPIALTEDFSKMTAGSFASPNGTDISFRLDNYMQTAGWTGEKVFQAGGYCKLGSNSSAGAITTPPINLSGNNNTFTVAVKIKSNGNNRTFRISSGNQNFEGVMSNTDETHVYKFTNGTASSSVTISAFATGVAFVDEITIYNGDVTSNLNTVNRESEKAPANGQWSDYIRNKVTEVNTTETFYNFTNLEEAGIYSYTVKALNNGKESPNSDEVIVDLKNTGIKNEVIPNWIKVDKHSVIVTANIGDWIEIYTPNAVLVKAVTAINEQTFIDLPKGNIYIVRKGNDTAKIVVP